MSNSSNQTPSSKPNSRQLEEWVAVIVALLSIGSIFFWVMLRDNSGFSFKSPEISIASSQTSEASDSSNILKVKPTAEEEDEKSPIQRDDAENGDDAENVKKSSSLPATGRSRESENNSFLSQLPTIPLIVNSVATVPITATPETAATTESTESKPTETETAATTESTESKPTETETAATTESSESKPTETETAATTESTESKPTETAATPEENTEETTVTSEPTEPTETAATTTVVKLSDVANDYWAKPAIDSMVSRNIINPLPDGSFQPDTPVTRAELAVQLQKVFAQEAKQNGVTYQDLPKDSATASAINQASQSGFLSGYPGNVFRPDQQVPRVQVLVAIASGLNLELPENPEAIIKQYKDVKDIPNYAIAKVAAATEKGLVVNYPDRTLLNPNQPATRAEVSAMIYQALAISGEVEPLSNPYVVKP
jgi:hypothetical protein